jgi:hypothetical protein
MSQSPSTTPENAENQYRFEFKGKTQPDISAAQLSSGLAKIFNCPELEVEALSNGSAFFIRKDLNKFTATSYQQRFASIGAIGEVVKIKDPEHLNTRSGEITVKTEQNGNHCPKCLSEDINTEQCHTCGIYFAKFLEQQHPSPVNPQTVSDTDLNKTEQAPTGKRAVTWLSSAVILLTVAFTADGMLQDLRFLEHAGIDIGYLPFFIGHIALIRGCVLLAQNKGYNALYGSLGFLSLIGLSILMLLPDRLNKKNQTDAKTRLTALSCVIISLYWLYGYFASTASIETLQSESKQLAIGRSEYPSSTINSNNELYQSEYREVSLYLDSVFKTLEEHSFRPDEITTLADNALGELARYERWINYQQYLHHSTGKTLPTELSKETLKKRRQDTSNLLSPYIKPGSSPRVEKAYQDWFYGLHTEQNATAKFMASLNQYLMRIFDLVRNQQFSRAALSGQSGSKLSDTKLSDEMFKPDLSQINFPQHDYIQHTFTQNTITLTSTSGKASPLAKTPLTLAVYMKPYQSRRGKTGYLFKLVPISAEFPNKYLHSFFNVFHNYPHHR